MKRRIPAGLLLGALVAVGIAVGIAACGGSGSGKPTGSGSVRSLTGAGSTLVAPLVSEWTAPYQQQAGVEITYGAIGSGAGIESIVGRTVDFAASDAPLTASQATVCKGCLEIPWALSATLVAYNVKGVPSGLRFTGQVLAGIWTGRITTWSDPRIRKLNPGVKLPDTRIVPVHRTDGSGDTYAFTSYLSQSSAAFKSEIGSATSVSWPGGIGGNGNSGVGGVLASTNGSIAYMAIAYVFENNFDYGLVENAAGKFPTPGIRSIAAAAAMLTTVPTSGTSGISLVDPPASEPAAYPLATFSYVLVPTASTTAAGTALKRFISWAVTAGQRYGPDLDFAPLPAAVVSADQQILRKVR